MIDEPRYLALVHETFAKVLHAFDALDADDADAEQSGDVVTVTFRDASRCVVNTQRAARQLWVAGGQHAWHFSYDEETGQWIDSRPGGGELFATLRRIVLDTAGVELPV